MEGSAGVTAMDTSTAAAPVPERATVWGEVAALSEKVSVPVLLPVVLGENVMPTVQERVAPIPEPQVLLAMAKLAEGAAIMLLKVRAELWLFVRLTVMAALVSPIGRLPKDKLVGERVTGKTPTPVSLAVWGLLLALSVTVTFPVNVPVPVGVKVIGMVQLAPLASLAGLMGHVPPVLCAKSPVTAMLVMVSAAVLVFLSVAVWGALSVPSTVLGKEGGDRVCARLGAASAKAIPGRKIQLRRTRPFIIKWSDRKSTRLN